MKEGDVLSLLDEVRIKSDAPTDQYGSQGTFHPYQKNTGPLNGDRLKITFRKEGKNLVAGAPGYGRSFEISPYKDHISVSVVEIDYEVRTDRLVASVRGYPSVKGIMRAKREVQYLNDEPEELEERLTRGSFLLIEPGQMTICYPADNRPEEPLPIIKPADPVPAALPVTTEVILVPDPIPVPDIITVPDMIADPCGARACSDCEIGGCDHSPDQVLVEEEIIEEEVLSTPLITPPLYWCTLYFETGLRESA